MNRNRNNPTTSSQRLEEKMERLTKAWINDEYDEKWRNGETKREPLLGKQKEDLKGFIQQMEDDGKSSKTMNAYASQLVSYARWLKKPFKKANEDDIKKYFREIRKKTDSIYSINGAIVKIRMFYRWLYGLKKGEYPSQVANLKQRKEKKKLPIDSFLSDEERKKFINTTDNLRDRALLMILWDSGARISEILDLRIKNISFDEYGAVILIHGKTGDRRVRLLEASPDLRAWIDHHPFKDEPEAPVWQSFKSKNSKGIALHNIYWIFDECKKKARIKKRINPHLFRHMRITEHASVLTEQELKVRYGWTRDSKMASIYVNLNGQDVDEKLMAEYGIGDFKEKKRKKLEKRSPVCPRCNTRNSPMNNYCSNCGMPLLAIREGMEIDAKTAKEMERKSMTIGANLIKALESNPDLAERIGEVLARALENKEKDRKD